MKKFIQYLFLATAFIACSPLQAMQDDEKVDTEVVEFEENKSLGGKTKQILKKIMLSAAQLICHPFRAVWGEKNEVVEWGENSLSKLAKKPDYYESILIYFSPGELKNFILTSKLFKDVVNKKILENIYKITKRGLYLSLCSFYDKNDQNKVAIQMYVTATKGDNEINKERIKEFTENNNFQPILRAIKFSKKIPNSVAVKTGNTLSEMFLESAYPKMEQNFFEVVTPELKSTGLEKQNYEDLESKLDVVNDFITAIKIASEFPQFCKDEQPRIYRLLLNNFLNSSHSQMYLYLCAKNGLLEIIKYFCENFNIEIRVAEKALGCSAENGQLEVIEYLCEKFKIRTEAIRLALANASLNGHLEITKYLCEKFKSEIESADNALEYASENGQLEVVKYFCENFKIKIEVVKKALGNASIKGQLEVVEYLCEKFKSEIESANNVLEYASETGQLEVVKYFCENFKIRIEAIEVALKRASGLEYSKIVAYLEKFKEQNQ